MLVGSRNSWNSHFMVFGTLLLILWGCASQPLPAPCTSTECLIQKGEAPKWINEPQGFYPNTEMLYGVGSASGIPNKSLLRRAAQENAKNQIAASIKASIKSSYSSTARFASSSVNISAEENAVSEALNRLVLAELVGSKIVAVWVNPFISEAYALAALNKSLACENILSQLKGKGGIEISNMKEFKDNCLRV